jgi:MoaA/NifB/PqqE/SkfB family radical SAM enzyme
MDIVKIEPVEPAISLTWTLSARCNYDCMYCPTEYHDSTSELPTLSQLKAAWLNFYNKTHNKSLQYKISFTGGEPTVNKAFLPFVSWLRQYDVSQIIVTTNGSASLSFYKKLANIVDVISISTHSEFINEKEFFKKVLELNKLLPRPAKSLHVNIMDEWWNTQRTMLYADWCVANDVSHSVNKINYLHQTRTVPMMKGTYNLDS